jgi:hypothetical protein
VLIGVGTQVCINLGFEVVGSLVVRARVFSQYVAPNAMTKMEWKCGNDQKIIPETLKPHDICTSARPERGLGHFSRSSNDETSRFNSMASVIVDPRYACIDMMSTLDLIEHKRRGWTPRRMSRKKGVKCQSSGLCTQTRCSSHCLVRSSCGAGAENRCHKPPTLRFCATKLNPRFPALSLQPEPMHTVNTNTSGCHSYGRLQPIVAGWQNRVFVSIQIVCLSSRA